MAGSIHSFTRGGALASAPMTVKCPATAPVGCPLALGIVVHGRNDKTTQHAYSHTQAGWDFVGVVDNYGIAGGGLPNTDYWQIWVFTRTKAEGDESWTFTSQVQTDPARTWIMVAAPGVVLPVASFAIVQDSTNVTAHSFGSLTMGGAGDLEIAFTIALSSEMSVTPTGLTFISENTKAGDGSAAFQSKISAWYQVVSGGGATGVINYTSLVARDFATIAIELTSTTGAQTAGDGFGTGMGEIEVPAYSGLPRLSAVNADDAAFDAALRDERNVPILLATFQPLESDAPAAPRLTERFSTGRYSRQYQGAIQSWPEITRSLYGDSKVGGRVGLTVGELPLLNNRELPPDVVTAGMRAILGGVLRASAGGEVFRGQPFAGTLGGQLDATAGGGGDHVLEGDELGGSLDADAGGERVRYIDVSRFYLPNYEHDTGSANGGDGDPGYEQIYDAPMNGAWATTDLTARPLRHRSGFIAQGWNEDSDSVGSTNNQGYRMGHFVSAPLAAQTISGTVKSWLQWEESNADDNIDQVYAAIHIISRDCLTLRATLLAYGQYDGGNAELNPTTPRNRVAIAAGTAISSYTCEAGDRIQVEYGTGHSGAGSTRRSYISLGVHCSGSSDLPENNTDTAAGTKRPWIEFSDTIKIEDNYIWPLLCQTDELGNFGQFASDVTQHTIDLTTSATGFIGGYKSGDRIIVFFVNDGNATVSVGAGNSFTKFVDVLADSSAARMTGWYFDCTGSSHTLRLDTSATEKGVYVAFVMPAGTFKISEAPEEGTVNTGSSTTPSANPITPSWGSSGYYQTGYVQVDWWAGGIAASISGGPFSPSLSRRQTVAGGVGIAVGASFITGTVTPSHGTGFTTISSTASWGSITVGFCPVN
jgi:hypothetical protein